MGKPYPEEDEDINNIRQLVETCPGLGRYLSHHIRSGLMGINGGVHFEDIEAVKKWSQHIKHDLERVGL